MLLPSVPFPTSRKNANVFLPFPSVINIINIIFVHVIKLKCAKIFYSSSWKFHNDDCTVANIILLNWRIVIIQYFTLVTAIVLNCTVSSKHYITATAATFEQNYILRHKTLLSKLCRRSEQYNDCCILTNLNTTAYLDSW